MTNSLCFYLRINDSLCDRRISGIQMRRGPNFVPILGYSLKHWLFLKQEEYKIFSLREKEKALLMVSNLIVAFSCLNPATAPAWLQWGKSHSRIGSNICSIKRVRTESLLRLSCHLIHSNPKARSILKCQWIFFISEWIIGRNRDSQIRPPAVMHGTSHAIAQPHLFRMSLWQIELPVQLKRKRGKGIWTNQLTLKSVVFLP